MKMKKVLIMALLTTTLVACDKSELEDAEEQVIVMKEKEKDPQTTDFNLFNSKTIGVKNEDPRGTQGNSDKDKSKEQQS